MIGALVHMPSESPPSVLEFSRKSCRRSTLVCDQAEPELSSAAGAIADRFFGDDCEDDGAVADEQDPGQHSPGYTSPSVPPRDVAGRGKHLTEPAWLGHGVG